MQEPAPPTIYRDLVQTGFLGSQLAVRTRIAPDAVAGAVREIESSVLKTVPIVRIMTMNEQIDASIVPERLIATLSGWFGALGAPLAFWAKSMAVSLVHGLAVQSPVSIAFGGAVMIVLGLVAAYIPARRAMGFDPMVALRCE